MKKTFHSILKVKHQFSLCLLIGTFSINYIVGQGVGEDLESGGNLVLEVSKTATDLADEWLVSKGLTQGDNNGKYFAVGTGAIPVPPTHKAFNTARINAYTVALLQAKRALVESIGVAVSTSAEFSLTLPPEEQEEIPTDPASLNEMSLQDKGMALIHHEFDKLMEQEGIAPEDKPKTEELVKKLLASESMSNAVKAMAQSAVSGGLVVQTFETMEKINSGEVAVVFAVSDFSRQLASAMIGKSPLPTKAAKDQTLTEYINGYSTEQLFTTFGCRPFIDSEGKIYLLAFSQAVPRGPASSLLAAAQRQAQVAGLGIIRNFAGEMLATNSDLSEAQSFDQFEEAPVDYFDESSFNDAIKTSAAALTINPMPVRKWKGQDSRSGKMVVGTVTAWNLEAAQMAIALGQAMDSDGGYKGGKGISGQQSNISQKNEPEKAGPEASNTPFKIQGKEADLDDF